MGTNNNLNVYFPINNLNPQGWVTEFITSTLQKTGNTRSDLANIFYDKIINKNNTKQFEKLVNEKTLTAEDFKKFKEAREDVDESKMSFLNGQHLDILEVDSSLTDSTLDVSELVKYTSFMSQIKPYQAAFLQPFIMLQYGYRRDKKEPFTYINFPFTQFVDLDFILNNPLARSEGCGITSITTTNQFNVSTHINSNISISYTFANMKVLTQEINEKRIPIKKSENERKYPFGFSFMKLVQNMNTNHEIIKLTYGNKVANGFNEIVDDQYLKDIIERKETKELLLNKNNHKFDFDEKGVVNLTINYLNLTDTSMLSPNNIAVPSKDQSNIQALNISEELTPILNKYNILKQSISVLEEKLQDSKKTSDATVVSKTNSEQIESQIKDLTAKLSKENKTFNLLKRSLKPNLTTIFLDKIKAQGQLFGVNFNTIKIDKDFKIKTNIFLVNPSDGDFKNIITYDDTHNIDTLNTKFFKEGDKSNDDLLIRIFARIFNSPYDEKQTDGKKTYGQIMFFPLKALISAGYSFLDAKTERDKIPHMLFGNVLMKNGTEMCSINIGDLLIETGVFQKWYYNKFYKKDRLEYSFGAFITDIITDLVPEALYRNKTGFDGKAPTSIIKQTPYFLSDDISPELKDSLYINEKEQDLRNLSKLLSKKPSRTIKPLIYYGQINNQTTQVPSTLFSNLGASEFNFDESKDAKKGIAHIRIGADGGVFTKVGFEAMDFSKIRSAFAFESLADNSSRYFIHYYSLSIEMLGNNIFDWDSVVCIPSNPLGIDSEENDPGIAGYYKVKGFNDSIDSNNNYTTTANAVWVFSPKNDNREKQKDPSIPVANIKIKDFIDVSANTPITYITELLENDANSIINLQLQKYLVMKEKKDQETKKDKETKRGKETKKDKIKKEKLAENVDRVESFKKQPTPNAKEKK